MTKYFIHFSANGNGQAAKNGDEDRKRKTEDKEEEVQPVTKKAKLADIVEEDDDIVCLE